MTRLWIITLSAVIALGAGTSLADPLVNFDEPLGNSGWRLQGPGLYNLQLAIDAEGETDGIKWIALTLSKNFRYGPDPFTGLFPAVELDFLQMDGVADEDLATRIIIQSELINNSTGIDWTGYNWRLYGHAIASFNRDLTNPTTDPNVTGWLISPFDSFAWETDPVFGTEKLHVADGLVLTGDAYFPGTGSGALVIDIDLESDPNRPEPAMFKFWQAPIPEPATMALLSLGGMFIVSRRRR